VGVGNGTATRDSVYHEKSIAGLCARGTFDNSRNVHGRHEARSRRPSLPKIRNLLSLLPFWAGGCTVPVQHDCAARHPVRRPPLHRSVAPRARGGDSCAPTPTRRLPSPSPVPPASQSYRSSRLGAAVEGVAELATGSPDRHACHGRALAPAGVRALLVVEIQGPDGSVGLPCRSTSGRWSGRCTPPTRPGAPRVFTASCRCSGSRCHSRPWRSTSDGVTGRRPRRGAPSSPITSVSCLDRLLHDPHRDLPRAVRVRGAVARPPTHRPHERNRTPDVGVDDPTATRRGRGPPAHGS
jgi:hypothetical protein